MTHQEIMAAIESLPNELQLAIANSVIDRLASQGILPVSDELKAEFLRREEVFFASQHQGEPWEMVREELFGK